MKKYTTKLLAALLSVFMLLTLVVPFSFAAGGSRSSNELKIMAMSDTHFILESMIRDTADYRTAVNRDQKVFNESEAVLDAQLEKVRQAKPDVLLLNGDLTKDGEYRGHKALAKKLKQLKKDVPGLRVYVTNGNHDINNSDAKDFNTADGKAVAAKKTTPSDFRAIYQSVSWDDATVKDTYTPPAGTVAGGLSYMARPQKGYTLIVVDSNCYSSDNTKSGEDEHETNGNIQADLMDWVQRKIYYARQRGDTVIGMMHHGVVAHFSQEQTILGDFLVNDYQDISTTLADAGMHYVFTGHLHSQDVAVMRTEAGNTLYDIETGSSITYPCPMRTVTFTRSAAGGTKTDNDVRETLTGNTIENISIDHTDPQTGKRAVISDMTAYAKTKALSTDVITTVLKEKLAGVLSSYPDALDTVIDTLIPDIANIPTTADGKHTLLETVNYAHQRHLAGLDHGTLPAWYQEARANAESGALVAALGDVLARDLAVLTGDGVNTLAKTDLVKGPAVDVLYHALFGAEHVLYYSVLQIAKDFNEFLALTLDSLAIDKNFPTDKTFTVTDANVVRPGSADWSSIDNGIPETNIVNKLFGALLGNN